MEATRQLFRAPPSQRSRYVLVGAGGPSRRSSQQTARIVNRYPAPSWPELRPRPRRVLFGDGIGIPDVRDLAVDDLEDLDPRDGRHLSIVGHHVDVPQERHVSALADVAPRKRAHLSML